MSGLASAPPSMELGLLGSSTTGDYTMPSAPVVRNPMAGPGGGMGALLAQLQLKRRPEVQQGEGEGKSSGSPATAVVAAGVETLPDARAIVNIVPPAAPARPAMPAMNFLAELRLKSKKFE